MHRCYRLLARRACLSARMCCGELVYQALFKLQARLGGSGCRPILLARRGGFAGGPEELLEGLTDWLRGE